MTVGHGHETSDLPPPWVTLAIVGLLFLIVIGALVAWGLVAGFDHDRPARPLTAFERAAETPAWPRLEVNGRADRLAVEQRAAAHLEGYGWTDHQGGLAHIPIERAMVLQVAQGWPDADRGPSGTARTGGEGGGP